jgi:1-acyl-sn-glycerol-3-phosphate acyltransferase
MTIDGFRPEDRAAFAGYEPAVAQAIVRGLERVSRVLRVRVDGLERIPAGRAVLVANHTFGFDIAFAASRITSELSRSVWTLGEHAWWTVPGVRRLAAAVGIVDGTPENADRLLSRDELVLVLPGGLREALKPHELRYRLLWKKRYGFVRTAVRNQAPLVPVAALGAEDLLHLAGDAFGRSRRLHLPFPLPRPFHYLPIPHPTALRYVVGEPIPTAGIALDDEAAHRRLRREVEGSLHEIFEEELARRAGQ